MAADNALRTLAIDQRILIAPGNQVPTIDFENLSFSKKSGHFFEKQHLR